jgi:hypothetical protein
MEDTIDAIVAASGQPLSIVIVGVGKADFDKVSTPIPPSVIRYQPQFDNNLISAINSVSTPIPPSVIRGHCLVA